MAISIAMNSFSHVEAYVSMQNWFKKSKSARIGAEQRNFFSVAKARSWSEDHMNDVFFFNRAINGWAMTI